MTEIDHLHVMLAQPEYLPRNLNLRTYDQAVSTINKYYPFDRFPQKTLYVLAELLPNGS